MSKQVSLTIFPDASILLDGEVFCKLSEAAVMKAREGL